MKLPGRPTRRSLLQGAGGAGLLTQLTAQTGEPGRPFEHWTPGSLDIHHISTGRGNATLFILPDGTTLMVDAGAIYGNSVYLIDPKPDNSRRPGEWAGRYVKRRLSAAGLSEIDYFVATHLHGDHIGFLAPECPLSSDGAYRLTGASDVAALVPCERFLDRGWPDYAYPAPLTDDFQINYRAFLKSRAATGAKVERFRAGSADQLRLLHKPADYPTFGVQNLASNGDVWTGEGATTRSLYPALSSLKPADYPVENGCSIAFRLRYGNFRYYTGGDLIADTRYGRDPWRDIESPVAQACGPVSVAVANHHGHYNANGPTFVKALRPRVFIIPAWDSLHPAASTLAAMFSKDLYETPRDAFATAMKPENKIANRRIADLRSANGHVVVRVAAGGESFRVVTVDNSDESDRVTGIFGPYS